jgi:hypothetical protein
MEILTAYLPWLIFIAGVLHFGLLVASGLTPQVLDWRNSLRPLDKLLRQVIWVHGSFIVLVIIGFGVLSLGYSRELAAGTPLTRGLCGFIALFWAARLGVQFFVFDAKPHLTSLVLKAGYHGLTPVFAYFAVIYAAGALV